MARVSMPEAVKILRRVAHGGTRFTAERRRIRFRLPGSDGGRREQRRFPCREPDRELARTQTQMNGAVFSDFSWRRRAEGKP